MKLTDLVGPVASWNSRKIFPASVPHLLHHDLTLLWVLERENPPASWAAAIDAWRALVCNFLLGELTMRPQALEGQLLRYAERFGVTQLTVFLHQGQEVAVSSPTVLLRPLPDADHAALRNQLPRPDAADRLGELNTLVSKLLETLTRAESPHASALRDMLTRHIVEHYRLRNRNEERHFGTTNVVLPLSPRVNSTLWTANPPASLDVLVRSSLQLPLYLPRCTACLTPLTRGRDEFVEVGVGAQAISLPCPKDPSHSNSIPLNQFYVHDTGTRVVAWEDRGPLVGLATEWAPVPKAAGGRLIFEWDPMYVPDQRRFLTLQFPNREVTVAKVQSVFFQRLLIVGDRATFGGVPVKPDWRASVGSLRPTVIGDRVEYRDVRLQGIPQPFTKFYSSAEIVHEPNGMVGVYPRPLPAYWKRYRCCLGGTFEHRVGLKIIGLPSSDSKHAIDVKTGWPSAIWVQSDGESLGVGYLQEAPPPIDHATVDCRVAVDFGTSTTSIAYAVGASEDVVEPGKLREALQVLAGTGREPIGFLPDHGYEPGGDDPSLFPSAVWSDGLRTAIRWTSQSPSAPDPAHHRFKAYHGFKWDDAAPGQHSVRRIAYLDELLFLSTGAIAANHETSALDFGIGFAFPLAFDHDRRRWYARDLQTVVAQIGGFDHPPTLFAQNESASVVRAFGGTNPGDAYLVADLGGGSLDLAVFERGHRDTDLKFLQVGSIKFGGELLLRRVTRNRTGRADVDEAAYWQVREAVTRSRVAMDLPGALRTFHDAAVTFLPFALEIVRITAASYSEHHPGRPLNYLLVGNGWRAAQFAGTSVLSVPDGYANIRRHCEEFRLQALAPVTSNATKPKRYVSLGVMKAMQTDPKNELLQPAAEDQSRLAAGLGIIITAADATITVPWHQLVGLGAEPVHATGVGYQELSIEFDRGNVAAVPDVWRRRLESAIESSGMGDGLPSDRKLLDYVRGAFATDRLMRGPLQIVAEQHWAPGVEGASANV